MLRRIAPLLVVLAAAIVAGFFWVSTLAQPLVDFHEFRQTQTALTALFMQPGLSGFFNYETPVLGAPWSVPFELPLFQALAAGLASLTSADLSLCGRGLSVLFGLACIFPALGLLRRFDCGREGAYCFLILYLSSSIYLYWNRTFMIESAALFFSLLSLYFFALLRPAAAASALPPWPRFAGLLLALTASLSLALLVKATTGLPIFLLLALDLLWQTGRGLTTGRSSLVRVLLGVLPLAVVMLVAFLLLRAWTSHADALKNLNPIGAVLTSGGLGFWNFGTPEQRWSADLWDKVVVGRMLTPVGVLPAIVLLSAGLLRPSVPRQRTFIAAALILALLPLLIFTNLHIIHEYYQCANQIFLLLALSASFAAVSQGRRPKWVQAGAWVALFLFVFGSYQQFVGFYLESSSIQTSDKLVLGSVVREQTSPETAMLVFGDDWSSAFPYHSHRRALAMPEWASKTIPTLDEVGVLKQSIRYLGGRRLGAVITNHELDPIALKQGCPASRTVTQFEWKLYLCKA